MANANAVPAGSPAAILSGIKSLSDAAYQQAKAGDTTEAIARYVMDKEPGFPDELSAEGKAALVAGYRLRYNEIRPAEVYFKVSESQYVKAEEFKGDASKAEKVTVTPEMAVAFTTHEFGRLSESHGPQFKGIIEKVRNATSTYVSNRTKDLGTMVRRLKNEGKTRTRAAKLKFDERLKATFKDLTIKCINAHKDGDPEADKAKLAKAIGAFNAVWNA